MYKTCAVCGRKVYPGTGTYYGGRLVHRSCLGNRRRGFYHVSLRNVGAPVIRKARVISRFEGDNRRLEITTKWDSKAEPFDNYMTRQVVPQAIVDAQSQDILPTTNEPFAVFIKYEGENEIYPFNAFSYLYEGLKPPHNQLGLGVYVVTANLVSENYRCSFSFRVNNSGQPLNSATIEPIRDYRGSRSFHAIDWEWDSCHFLADKC